ncbi:MAG TPA: vitamin K epoxide reductase family protein, partial [Streptosporangiaceae bacterium]
GRNTQPPQPESQSMVRRVLGAVGGGLGAAVRWSGGGLAFTTMVVSVLGLADAAYLTYQHFSGSTAFAGCAESSTVNCEAVTTSPESHIAGIPVSVLGLAFFVFMIVVNSRWGWKAPWPAVHWARLASVVVGIVFVLYLIWAELFRINAICLYCTGVHILTFILFALIIGRAAFSGVKPITDND